MTILLFIKKYYKQILILITILLLIISALIINNLSHKISKLKDDYERMTLNLNNSEFIISQYKDKNGKLVYENSVLMLTKDELNDYNKQLTNEIKDLKIKLKNVMAITNIQYVYEYCVDTIPVYFQAPYYVINYDTTNLILKARLNTINKTLENTKISVTDSLIMVWEYQTKGWWIFKRKTGLKLKFQSSNPFLELKGMQNYYLINFKKKESENIWY